MGLIPGPNEGWANNSEQTSNGGGDYVQHDEVRDAQNHDRLIAILHSIRAPGSGTCTVKLQHSPNYNPDKPEEATWIDLKTLGTIAVGEDDIWKTPVQIPDGTTYTFFSYLRVVALNSEEGQSCRFDVCARTY